MPAGPADVRPLAARLAGRIRRDGPITVAEYVEAALYDPVDGFYMSAGRAGRAGDFLTAPEVGFLFGAVIARAIDLWWADMGSPESLVVVDLGAGSGTLTRSVLAAEPIVSRTGALRWAVVERSPEVPALRDLAVDVEVSEWPPAIAEPAIVLVNEVLDNTPFEVVERTPDGWSEVLIGVDTHDRFVTILGPPTDADFPRVAAPVGTRLPLQIAARKLIDDLHRLIPQGRLVVFDYGANTEDLARRPDMGWLRVYRRHDNRGSWLTDPGTHDITVDVAIDQITPDHPVSRLSTQADFLRRHGIEELVEEGRGSWRERAHVGDLEALKARSRVAEAGALLDPAGMGGFFVAEWII